MAGGALQGKRAVVTGGSSGIGRAIAVAFAEAGAAAIVVTYHRNADGAHSLVEQLVRLGVDADALPLDLADAAAITAFAEAAQRRLGGGVDAWVNNAGADILTGAWAKRPREEKLAYVLEIDVKGTALASWAAHAIMREQERGGVILNVSWDHVGHGMAGENPMVYAAAKGGVLAFSKSLAREAAPTVRVNVLAPGFIETAFGEQASPSWRAHVEQVTPLRRWGTPEDVAQAAVYLASDAAAFLTGQTVMVNGGVVM
jgi:3-oxoacyl-[acyl-carrier protein] reductase